MKIRTSSLQAMNASDGCGQSLAGICESHHIKHIKRNPMKKIIIPMLVVFSAMTLLTGCSWQVGGGTKSATIQPTTGQQLMDLQKAKDTGAITDSEYQAQKAKLLGSK
jgi:hypothetical protein